MYYHNLYKNTETIVVVLLISIAACNGKHQSPKSEAIALGTKTPAAETRNTTTTDTQAIDLNDDAKATEGQPTDGTWYTMPNLDSWRGLSVTQPADHVTAGSKYALAYHFDGKIFKKKAPGGEWLTYIRRSNWVKVNDTEQSPGCEKGTWYEAVDGGFVCTSRGFKVSEEKKEWPGTWLLPDTSRTLPFAYAEVTRHEALSLYRLPKANELEALRAGKTDIEVVKRQFTGDNLLALHRKVSRLEHSFYETVRGRFVLAKDLKSMPGSTTHGIFFPKSQSKTHDTRAHGKAQSIAFVFTKDAHAYKRSSNSNSGASLDDLGPIPRYARFAIKDQPVTIDNTVSGASTSKTRYVEDNLGHLVRREDVRLAKIIDPPSLVGTNKWIHVNRKEQTLTAYVGKRPVFATMISSGKPGFDTPSGLQRIYEKHISRTMRGSDPKEGSYVVEEVPWTMYYQDSYALHGAYWHDDFGNTKSHGCTNIPPADARWLFYWTSPKLKTHWHATRDGLGTFVYIQ